LNYTYRGNVDILIERVKMNITYQDDNLIQIQRENVGFLKGNTVNGRFSSLFEAGVVAVNPLILPRMLAELASTGKIDLNFNMKILVRYIAIYYEFPLNFKVEMRPTLKIDHR
jgi:hypothetical protein